MFEIQEYSLVIIVSEPTPPPTAVECTDNSITVYIPRYLIDNVDASHLHFLDDSCVGTSHNQTHVQIMTAFDTCGTLMEVSFNSLPRGFLGTHK